MLRQAGLMKLTQPTALDIIERDDARTAWLESVGFTVLRFWNDDVLRDIECVMQEITRVVDVG